MTGWPDLQTVFKMMRTTHIDPITQTLSYLLFCGARLPFHMPDNDIIAGSLLPTSTIR